MPHKASSSLLINLSLSSLPHLLSNKSYQEEAYTAVKIFSWINVESLLFFFNLPLFAVHLSGRSSDCAACVYLVTP